MITTLTLGKNDKKPFFCNKKAFFPMLWIFLAEEGDSVKLNFCAVNVSVVKQNGRVEDPKCHLLLRIMSLMYLLFFFNFSESGKENVQCL